jgi:SPP1 gp7 family putative phage head morphogenesis protein
MGLAKLFTKILDFFSRSKSEPEPAKTAKNESPKVSYAESPHLYVFEQFKLATDRISIVRDVKQLVKTDLRFAMTNHRLSADAARGGFKVVVAGSEAYRQQRRRQGKSGPKRLTPGANIAQQVIDDFLKRTKLASKSKGYIRVLLRDGDLFMNPVVDLNFGLILDVRRAPVLTIKRNCDEYGEFLDPERAFSQIDPITQLHVLMEIGPPSQSRADFALYQMNQVRWLWDENENYGTSHYASARAMFRILQKMEWAAAIRREFRSVKKRSHKLPDTAQQAEVTEYMRNVGLIDKDGNPTKNAHLLSDFVGTAEVTALNDSSNLDEMDDIKYFEELLWLNFGVPKAILTAGADINRDVLKVQYPHYLQTLEDITDVLEFGDSGPFSGYRAIVDLQLLLAGINPDAVNYDIVWSDKTDETPAERIDRIQKALGAENGVKVITIEKAIQEIAGDFDIEDPVGMALQLEEERQQREAQQQAAFKQQSQKQQSGQEQEPVTDVMLEDRPKMEVIEAKAQAAVLRFFRAIYQRMMNYSEPLTDASTDETDVSEESILTLLNDAWDEEQGKYQVGIVNQMTQAGVVGVTRALQLIDAPAGGGEPPRIEIKLRITRTDIRDDLMEASGDRIKDIKQTTLNNIRETLAEGFEADSGWKNIMEQLQPVIVDEVRAEMIAKTELSWAYDRSSIRIYKGAGYGRVQADEVMDEKTCPVCRGRHGNVYPIDEWPGLAHPRCRVTPLPYD